MRELVSPTITTVRFDVPDHMKHVASRIKVALGVEAARAAYLGSFSSVVPRESA